MSTARWWEQLFASIDAKQTQVFVTFLCDDALLRYGSGPEVQGRSAIAAHVERVFATFRSCSHALQEHWQVADCRIGRGVVTYTRFDAREVVLPFCNIFAMRGELIARYEIYVDPTPLFAA